MQYLVVFASIALGAVGQLFLKLAAIQSQTAENAGFTDYYINLLKTPYTYIGAFSYGLSFLVWMLLLKKYDLSFLRPLVGIGYILTSILAWVVLKERITVVRWVGIALIVAGVYLIGISARQQV
ncbi:MAG: EamA family transporter [Spirochaetales bacterium]|nr:EamA family transporter [Spirochaetales bacterium]